MLTQTVPVFHEEQIRTIQQSIIGLLPIIEDLEETARYLYDALTRNAEMRCADGVDELVKFTEHAHLRERLALTGILISTLKGCVLTTTEVLGE